MTTDVEQTMSTAKRNARRAGANKRKRRVRQSRQPPAPHQRITNANGAAAALDCSRDHVYGLLNSGAIASYLDGRSRKIVVASLDAYVARLLEASNKRWERSRFYSVKEQRQAGKGADAANP
jgi:excisionase family DNA binding protein